MAKDKPEIVFVIRSLQKGVWYYYRRHENIDRIWDTDLYVAAKFESYKDAEDYLIGACDNLYWGGFFHIEKYYVNR